MEKKIYLNPRIPLTKEESEKILNDAFTLANIAYILSDTVHSYFLDATSKFAVLGVELKDEDKHHFLEMKKYAERAQFHSKQLAKHIYDMEESEDALRDSDWFYNLIKLVQDRLGEDKVKTHQFLEYLSMMPSEGTFKVGIEDFQKM